MKQVQFTEFRQNASSYFDSVEEGQSLEVLRHGKIIARVSPVSSSDEELSWKQNGPRISLDQGSLSEEILKERRES